MDKSTNSSSTHLNVEHASTLNRHYVRRPKSYTNYSSQNIDPSTSAQLESEALRRRQILAEKINRQNLQHLQKVRAAQKQQQQQAQQQRQQRSIVQKPQSRPTQSAQPRPISISQPQSPQIATRSQQSTMQPKQNNISSQTQSPLSAQFTEQSNAARLAQAAKERATDNALQVAALQSVATDMPPVDNSTTESKKPKKKFRKTLKESNNKARFVIALAASAACIVALGLVIKLNMPDLSVRVAALQTGIEATYPSYLPNGYQLSGVSTGKDDTIIMDFSGEDGKSFTITEEKSSWDSNALLNNYVKSAWNNDYSVIREQGITIYLSSSDATWVNGGLLFHLTSPSADTLTKKEIKNIVTSL